MCVWYDGLHKLQDKGIQVIEHLLVVQRQMVSIHLRGFISSAERCENGFNETSGCWIRGVNLQWSRSWVENWWWASHDGHKCRLIYTYVYLNASLTFQQSSKLRGLIFHSPSFHFEALELTKPLGWVVNPNYSLFNVSFSFLVELVIWLTILLWPILRISANDQ